MDDVAQRRIQAALEPAVDRLRVSMMETMMELDEWREKFDTEHPERAS